MKKYTIDYIRKNNLILLEVISGSHLYGTALENGKSDIDIRGIFYMEHDDLLSMDYVDQINDDKNDIIFYELGRFIDLAMKNNPNILELLADIPEDCLIYRHPIMDMVKSKIFLSKICKNSFGGYAEAQIKKARGLNKKIVNPVEGERKTPLDFCYAIFGQKTMPLRKFLEEEAMDQKFCGVVNIPNARDVYALFWDQSAFLCFSEKIPEKYRKKNKERILENEKSLGYGFKGIEIENSNDIRLSSIPKGLTPICTFIYNKDGYTTHCKKYKEYHEWLEKRNPERYRQNIEHGKNYDSKNLMHCHRLLDMASEIAEGKIIVRRPNRDYLLSIRKGIMDYDTLVQDAENKMKIADEAFDKSSLPDTPDRKEVNKLLISMRKKLYNLN